MYSMLKAWICLSFTAAHAKYSSCQIHLIYEVSPNNTKNCRASKALKVVLDHCHEGFALPTLQSSDIKLFLQCHLAMLAVLSFYMFLFRETMHTGRTTGVSLMGSWSCSMSSH